MKIKAWYLVAVISALILTAGCVSKENFTLNITLEPAVGANNGISNSLPDAAPIIKKRLNNFGIKDENLKMDVTGDRINLTITKFDTATTSIIENLVTLPGRIGFWSTYENKDVIPYLTEANKKLIEMRVIINNEESSAPLKDSLSGEPSLMDQLDPKIKSAEDSAAKAFRLQNPLFGVLSPRVNQDGEPLPSCMIGLANLKDTSTVNGLLKMKDISSLFPRDLKFFWSRYPYKYDETKSFYELHAIKVTNREGLPELDGNVITSAEAKPSRSEVRLNFSMNSEGTRIWSRMTRDNIDLCIAIIIDDYVRSYPRVMNEITGGNTEITGDFTMAEAKYLSFIFNSGGNGLPLKLRIAEEKINAN